MAERYIVKVDFDRDGIFRETYRGNDYELAAGRANFWDELTNVQFIDTWYETPLDRAMRRFDEAIAKLKREKEIIYG